MDSQQLLQVMLEEAKDLSKKDDATEDSIVGDYTKRQKTKYSTSKAIFKQSILAVLGANGHKEDAKKIWPADWDRKTFKELAQSILALLMFLMAFLPTKSQIQIDIAAGKTELKNDALIVGVSYLRSLDSLWSNRNMFIQRKNSFTSFYPEFDIRTGTADAFSSINLKVKGLTMKYKLKKIGTVSRTGVREDIIAPDLSKTFHTFPFSLGIESNNRFDNMNAVAEWGWAPWLQQIDLLDNVEFYTGIQTGRVLSKNTDSLIGGEINKSLENTGEWIGRLHASVGGTIDTLFKGSPFKIGAEGNFNTWYDFVNGKLYYSAVGNLKFYISNGTTVLIGINKGSAAPLFNEALQYQVGASFKL